MEKSKDFKNKIAEQVDDYVSAVVEDCFNEGNFLARVNDDGAVIIDFETTDVPLNGSLESFGSSIQLDELLSYLSGDNVEDMEIAANCLDVTAATLRERIAEIHALCSSVR